MVSLTSATDLDAEAAGGPKPSTSTGMTRARSGTFSTRREWTLEETFKAMARTISDCPTYQDWSYMCESVEAKLYVCMCPKQFSGGKRKGDHHSGLF